MDPDLELKKGGSENDDPGQRPIPANEVNEIVSNRVNEVNAKHAEETGRLQGQIDVLTQQSKQTTQPQQKTYSRAELNAAVTEGKISQDEADQIVDKQLTTQITADVTDNLTQQGTENSRQVMINSYVSHDPDIATPGTDARKRVEAEVRAQLELSGDHTATLRHEVLALRAIYGDVNKLGKVNTKPEDRETHMDTLQSSNDSGSDKKQSSQIKVDDSGNITGLARDEKAYYQDLINKGVYRDWKAVEVEMKFSDAALRQRAGAR